MVDLLSPKVAVCLYVECEDTLIQSLMSVIAQTYANLEILIVFNGEQSKLSQSIKDLINSFSIHIDCYSIKYKLSFPELVEFASLRTKAIYIAFLSSEGIMHRERIKLQVNFLEKNRHIDIVGSSVNYIDLHGYVIINRIEPQLDQEIKVELLNYNYSMINQAILVKNSFLKATNLSQYNDFNYIELSYWQNLISIAHFANLDIELTQIYHPYTLKNSYLEFGWEKKGILHLACLKINKRIKSKLSLNEVNQNFLILLYLKLWILNLFPNRFYRLLVKSKIYSFRKYA